MKKYILQKGETASYDYLVDEKMQLNFGKTFDDFTLLHYDDQFARDVAFERRPVQGALIGSILVKSIVKAFGDSTILKSHNITFHKPVYPGSTISTKLIVLKNIRNKLVTVKTEVWVGENLHYEGETKIRVFEEI